MVAVAQATFCLCVATEECQNGKICDVILVSFRWRNCDDVAEMTS